MSPVQAVRACKERLESAGFLELPYDEPWKLQKNGRYYVNHHDTTLFAFTVGEGWQETKTPQIRMAAAHTDFPCLRIKPSADVTACGYAQVNVEVYGGAILNTWLDRPLGIAGRVAVRTQDAFAPKIVEFVSEKNLMTIPNLAIHMNREVNKGVELNRQTDMLPVFALLPEEEKKADYFLTFLADELSVEKTDILDFELTVYCKENPEFIGLNDDFISSPRLDNLTSCAALISGLIDARRMEGINLIALFDHEEIGSRSKQGAGSILLHDMLRRILKSWDGNRRRSRISTAACCCPWMWHTASIRTRQGKWISPTSRCSAEDSVSRRRVRSPMRQTARRLPSSSRSVRKRRSRTRSLLTARICRGEVRLDRSLLRFFR